MRRQERKGDKLVHFQNRWADAKACKKKTFIDRPISLVTFFPCVNARCVAFKAREVAS